MAEYTDIEQPLDEGSATEGRWQGLIVAGLFMAVILTPIIKIGNLPPLRVDDVLVIFLFFGAWVWSSRRGENFLFGPGKGFFSVLYILLGVVYLASYLIGLSAGHYPLFINDAFYTPATVVRLLLYFLVGASARPTSSGWRTIVWTVMILGVAQAVVLMVQYNNMFGLRAATTDLWGGFEKMVQNVQAGMQLRATGTMGNTNAAGAAAAMAIGAPLALLLYGRGIVRRFIIPIAAVAFTMTAIVSWTLSRSSTIIALFSIAATLLTIMGVGRQKARVLFIAPLVLIAGVILYSNVESLPLPDRVKSVFMPTGKDQTAVEAGMYSRTQIWALRAQEVHERANPVTGFGPSKYLEQTVDNDYMAAYYKTGLLGLMLVLAIRLMATVRSATNMVRMRTLAHSQAATMLFFMNISLLLFGITADITLGPKLGNIIALSTGLIFTLGISARQSIEDVEIQGVLSEMDYASV